MWNLLEAGLNAQLRTVRHGFIRSTLSPVIRWIDSHANPQLEFHGVRIDLGWFHATASGYYQLGIWVVVDDYTFHSVPQPVLMNTNDHESPRQVIMFQGSFFFHFMDFSLCLSSLDVPGSLLISNYDH